MPNETAMAFVEYSRYKLREDYFPKIRKCCENLSEEDVWRRPNEHSNSVGNILLHLCGNLRQWIIHGLGGVEDVRNRPQEFAERSPIPKAQLLAKLEGTLKEVDETLARFDLSRLLEKKTVQGFAETNLTVVYHVVEHFAQHLGQISYITKMLCDVDLKYFHL
ncbi:MAG: DinB family protein [Candidatus Omnitrophota bacterium]